MHAREPRPARRPTSGHEGTAPRAIRQRTGQDTAAERPDLSARTKHQAALAQLVADSPRAAGQRSALPSSRPGTVRQREEPVPDEKAAQKNDTGLPDSLKSGVEQLSGMSLDNVRVHYNSQKPAAVGALAYAQGTDIHVAPGQEEHLPHEAWHVVQQAQGRVKPTMQMRADVPVNDDPALESEADAMGAKAVQRQVSLANTALTNHQG